MDSTNIVCLFLITLEKVPQIYASRPEYPLKFLIVTSSILAFHFK